jgi:hypothetical protein
MLSEVPHKVARGNHAQAGGCRFECQSKYLWKCWDELNKVDSQWLHHIAISDPSGAVFLYFLLPEIYFFEEDLYNPFITRTYRTSLNDRHWM